MKRKTIEKIITGKVNAWINSIEDKELQILVGENTIVTGGSITSLLLGETVNDYDVYFRNKETVLAVANYYARGINDVKVKEFTEVNIHNKEEERVVMFVSSSGVVDLGDDEDKKPYRPIFISENAITLSDKFQIVLRFYGEPDEIHDNYDFVHACNYLDMGLGGKKLVLNEEALTCILTKQLIYRGSLYPICSLFRIKKFIERGWTITAGEILKIAFQVSELDLSDIDVLRNQLTGVDAAYFFILIAALENNDKEITSTYIGNLIDEIWEN